MQSTTSAEASTPCLLTVKKIATVLGVSTATVYKLCETGRLRHLRVSDRSIRVLEADLATFVARNVARTPGKSPAR
jgi:excisionase family DNA binding protein